MAIINQILLICIVLAAVYASFVYNRAKYDEIIGILPDFRRLIQKPPLSSIVNIVVFVPDAYADAMRQAVGEAGGGVIGNYTFCSFSSQGIGRYVPGHGAHPMVGKEGVLELANEERIEFRSSRQNLPKVIIAIKKISPYEETVIDIYPIEEVEVTHPAQSHH